MAHEERRSEGDELVEQFAKDLRELRIAAGKPTYEKLGHLAGCSKSTVHEALTGARLPSLDITLGLVHALGANEQQWCDRWKATRRVLDERRPPLSPADLLDEAERLERHDAYPDSLPPGSETGSPTIGVDQRRRIPVARRSRQRWRVPILGFSMVIVLTVGIAVWTPWCNENQHVVWARDLWLRNENGKRLSAELREGEIVVVKRQHPTSERLWYVEAVNGRAGWVDKNYLKQSCGS
jgi:Helix-turn-helix domain